MPELIDVEQPLQGTPPLRPPPRPRTLWERFAALSTSEQAAFRIRRQFAGREVTDDEILSSLELAAGKTLGGALGTLGRGAAMATEVSFAPINVPLQLGVAAGARIAKGKTPFVKPLTLLEEEEKLPLYVRLPSELAVAVTGVGALGVAGKVGRVAGALRLAQETAGMKPGLRLKAASQLGAGLTRKPGVAGEELAPKGLAGKGPGLFDRNLGRIETLGRLQRGRVREASRKLEAALRRMTEAEQRLAEAQAPVPEFRTGAVLARAPGEGVSFEGPILREAAMSLQDQARKAADDYYKAFRKVESIGGGAEGEPLVVPAKVINWRRGPGGFPPLPDDVRDGLTDAIAAHPASEGKAVALARTAEQFDTVLKRYASPTAWPIIDRVLNRVTASTAYPAIRRNPTVNAIYELGHRLESVSNLHDALAVKALEARAQEAFGSKGFTKLKVNRGVSLPAGYKYEGHLLDIVEHPADYSLTGPQRGWLAAHTEFTKGQRDLEQVFGVKYKPRDDYAPHHLVDRKVVPEERVPGQPRFAVKREFQKPRELDTLRNAWAAGKQMRYESYGDAMAARSVSSAKGVGEKYAQRLAKEQADDVILQEVSALYAKTGIRDIPVVGGVSQAATLVANTVLGPDILSIMGQQVPLAFLRDPALVTEVVVGRLNPFYLEKPLHSFALMKTGVPRFLSANARMQYYRDNLDVISDMLAHGYSPISNIYGVTGALTDHLPLLERGIVKPLGKTIEYLTAAQFGGIMAPLKVEFYKHYTQHLLTARRSFFSPVGVKFDDPVEALASHVNSGLYPKSLTAKLPKGMTEDDVKSAVGDFLEGVFGGISPSKIGVTETQAQVERMFGIAPGWLRANVRLLSDLVVDDLQGQLARDFLFRSMLMYVGVGEAVSLATGGPGMNVTDPSKGSWFAIPVGPHGTMVQGLGRITGLMRAPLGTIYKSIEKGELDTGLLEKWGLAKLNPVVSIPLQLQQDKDIFNKQGITRVGENTKKSQAWFAFKGVLPVFAQNLLEERELGTLSAEATGLQGLGFNVWSMSPKRRLIMDALRQASVEAKVPEDQAKYLMMVGEDPTQALNQEGQYVLSQSKRSAARRRALEIAQKSDSKLTYADVRSRGFPSDETRDVVQAKFWQHFTQVHNFSEAHYERLRLLDERRALAIANPSDPKGLSGEAFRKGINNSSLARRTALRDLNTEFADFATKNDLADYLRQVQATGLSRMQADEVLRQAFLDQYEHLDLQDNATGAWKYEERDAVRQKWEANLTDGLATIKRWLTEGQRELPPRVQRYFDGLEAYKGYFKVREELATGQGQRVQKWLMMLEAAERQDVATESYLNRVAPPEVKDFQKRVTALKQALRRKIPGLDQWLQDYGYVGGPVKKVGE